MPTNRPLEVAGGPQTPWQSKDQGFKGSNHQSRTATHRAHVVGVELGDEEHVAIGEVDFKGRILHNTCSLRNGGNSALTEDEKEGLDLAGFPRST